MATKEQVYSALSISNTFNILNASAPINYQQFTDITDWTGLGITTGGGDTIKLLSQILDPVEGGVYENAGFASDVFTSPDCTLADNTAPQSTLNVYSGTTTPIWGSYAFNIKVQVAQSGEDTFIVEKTFYVELNQNLVPQLSLEETPNCGNATYKSVDTTSYGAPAGYSLQTIVRTHTVTPPTVSKRADGTTPQTAVTANAQTIELGSPNNPLWTGAYQGSLSAVLTYINSGNYTIVHVPIVYVPIIVDCDNNFCKLMCCLNSIIDKYNSLKGVNPTFALDYYTKWQKGTMWFFAILNQCNNPGIVEQYTKNFYLDTGCDPNCDCDCTDEPAPVIPTDIINGTDGADGLTPEFRVSGTLFQWKYTTGNTWNTLIDFSSIAGINGTSFLQGSGVPSGALGSNGDTYLNLTTNNIYFKSAGSWSITGNVQGATGVSVLYNSATNADNGATVGSYASLDSYSVLANTLITNGDELKVHAVFFLGSQAATEANLVRLTFGGNNLFSQNIDFYPNAFSIEINTRIWRVSNTEVNYETEAIYYSIVSGTVTNDVYRLRRTIATFSALNLTTTAYAIAAQANSGQATNIGSECLEVTLYKKST